MTSTHRILAGVSFPDSSLPGVDVRFKQPRRDVLFVALTASKNLQAFATNGSPLTELKRDSAFFTPS